MKQQSIVYEIFFNYYGQQTFKGKKVSGGFVKIAIHGYKSGKEINLTEDQMVDRFCVRDIFDVTFDQKKLITIAKDIPLFDLFKIEYGIDDIKAEVIGYGFEIKEDCSSDIPKEILDKMPMAFRIIPCSDSVNVSKEEFAEFLQSDIQSFYKRDCFYLF